MSPAETGKNPKTPRPTLFARVGPDVIDTQALYTQACTAEAGAIVQFCGTVRNHNQDAEVVALEYEAYPEMAEEHILAILQRTENEIPIWNASAVHRIGALALGDVAVCVTVAASHRDAAFSACRRVIDELKHEVPIWKHETLRSGDRRWIEEGHPPGSGSGGSDGT